MNILHGFASRVVMRNINNVIVQAMRVKDDAMTYAKFKKHINNEYGIFFINFLPGKDRNYTVMIKRAGYTYIYDVNLRTNEITLKGERRNANT